MGFVRSSGALVTGRCEQFDLGAGNRPVVFFRSRGFSPSLPYNLISSESISAKKIPDLGCSQKRRNAEGSAVALWGASSYRLKKV